MGYDFSQLNDKEFEILVVDLLSIVYNKRIERFKPGKDAGVDGRFFMDNGKEICLQCKHYLKSGYNVLISKLKNEESKKVVKLKPAKYIFITSLPLSRENKKEIKAIFHPYIKRTDDVFGQEDLNDLLVRNPKVEEDHFKLWISNTTVFNRIINNAIKGRSEFELEQIKNKAFKYIKTYSHDKAFHILNEKHVLIISGEPGIGKTTLAENLCLFFASKDYEFIVIEESLSEAENICLRGKKQIFYFDDFLGSNYFEAIENKKDSHIIKFIERIRNDKKKCFVLTSRTNILNSGILHSSVFVSSKIQSNEFMLTIDNLTPLDRAKILYNHIWFSKLPEKFIDEYYRDKRYKEIINHKNYNPRLIEFITDIERLNVSSSSDYWSYILNTLNNPKDIWNDCFKVQNNAYVRNLVKLAVFNGGNITETELRNSFNNLTKIEDLGNPSHTEKDFKSTSQLASKSFLNREKFFSNEETYSLFNPSIADFVLSEYSNDFDNLANIFKSLNTVKSLEHLLALEREQIISQEHIFQLKNMLFEDAFKQNKKLDYLIFISNLFRDDNGKHETIHKLLMNIIQKPSSIGEFSKLLNLLILYYKELNIVDYGFLLRCINGRNIDEQEIKDLAEFLETLEIDDESILDKLKSDIENFLGDELDSAKDDIDISKYIISHEGYDGDFDIDYDNHGIESEFSAIIESMIDDFHSDLVRNLDIDFDGIIDTIDIDQLISNYIDSLGDDDYEGYRGNATAFNNDIDDLFERS